MSLVKPRLLLKKEKVLKRKSISGKIQILITDVSQSHAPEHENVDYLTVMVPDEETM
jgi:hypothetical protein